MFRNSYFSVLSSIHNLKLSLFYFKEHWNAFKNIFTHILANYQFDMKITSGTWALSQIHISSCVVGWKWGGVHPQHHHSTQCSLSLFPIMYCHLHVGNDLNTCMCLWVCLKVWYSGFACGVWVAFGRLYAENSNCIWGAQIAVYVKPLCDLCRSFLKENERVKTCENTWQMTMERMSDWEKCQGACVSFQENFYIG